MNHILHQAARENFGEKVATVAQIAPTMTVLDRGSFVSVDCGMASDTFNVIVVRSLSTPDLLLQDGIGHFTAKQAPMALWYWEDALDRHRMTTLMDYGLVHTETHVAMTAALPQVRPALVNPDGFTVRLVEDSEDTRAFGAILAELFGASDEGRQVAKYFEQLSAVPVGDFPAMRHYIGTCNGEPVTAGTLFVGRETLGIYDIATRERYRRRGFGRAMFAYLLKEANSFQHDMIVLQASADGLHTYEQAGFKPTGTVHTFENRALLG